MEWYNSKPAIFPPLRQVNTGYQIRNPANSEIEYFNQNQGVAGMATNDNHIIFNPSWYKNATPVQKQGLYMIESARQYMKSNGGWEGIKLTPEQIAFFKSMKDKYYSSNDDLAKQTLISRIIGGDSLGETKYTKEQIDVADRIKSEMMKR